MEQNRAKGYYACDLVGALLSKNFSIQSGVIVGSNLQVSDKIEREAEMLAKMFCQPPSGNLNLSMNQSTNLLQRKVDEALNYLSQNQKEFPSLYEIHFGK